MRRLNILMAADLPPAYPGNSVAVMGDPLVHIAAHVSDPPNSHVTMLCRMPEGAGGWPRDGRWQRSGPAATCLWCAAREGRHA